MQVLGFVPTGWAYEMKRQKFPVYRKEGVACEIHLVPYSEHSSFKELLEFVKFLRPRQVGSTPDVVESPVERLPPFVRLIRLEVHVSHLWPSHQCSCVLWTSFSLEFMQTIATILLLAWHRCPDSM
jgi:hypothetical protein